MDKIHIWRIVLLSITLLVGVLGTPAVAHQNSKWRSNSAKLTVYNYPDSEDTPDSDEMAEIKEYIYDNSDHQDYKRGFSLLARWKPFNNIGRQRTSIRDISRSLVPPTKYDLVSAETRAFTRPGQPLRWG